MSVIEKLEYAHEWHDGWFYGNQGKSLGGRTRTPARVAGWESGIAGRPANETYYKRAMLFKALRHQVGGLDMYVEAIESLVDGGDE